MQKAITAEVAYEAVKAAVKALITSSFFE